MFCGRTRYAIVIRKRVQVPYSVFDNRHSTAILFLLYFLRNPKFLPRVALSIVGQPIANVDVIVQSANPLYYNLFIRCLKISSIVVEYIR